MTDPDLDPDLETNLLDEDDDSFEETAAPGTSHSGEDFEDLDEPELLCGLYWGHISDVKDNPQKTDQVIVECKSEEPESKGETALAWVSKSTAKDNFRNRKRLFTIAKYAGVPTCPLPDGRKGERLLGTFYEAKNKRCLFVVGVRDYNGERSASIAWGIPKDKESPEWVAYAKAQNGGKGFTAKQIAAIKDSPGIINPKHWKLFGGGGGD